MNKIKVAVIITKLELGGAQKVALSICEKLDKTKYEPILICGCGGILDKEAINKNIKIFFVKDLIRQINPIKDLKALFKICKILKQEKPIIVHTHSSKAGIIGRIAAKICGIKNIVHTIHGFSFNDTQSIIKKNLFVFLERFCALFTSALIPVSTENIIKGLKNKIGKKEQYKYIRLGIDIDNFKNFTNPTLKQELKLDKNDIVVTTIGPFKPQKNLPDFIKIAASLSNKNKHFKFVIVGDGNLRQSFEQAIKESNISDNIFLIGWRRDIANILHSSDFFIMTSLWEGLPISTIEALCCGLSPIVNDVDGQKEIIKNGFNGFLIKPYDIKDTEDKILLLYNNKELKQQLSINSKNSIDYTFSMEYMIKQHEDLYYSIYSYR